MTKTRVRKPKIPWHEPWLCANHPKRLAIVNRMKVDMCWVCYYDSLLEVIRDAFQRTMLTSRRAEWVRKYEEWKQ